MPGDDGQGGDAVGTVDDHRGQTASVRGELNAEAALQRLGHGSLQVVTPGQLEIEGTGDPGIVHNRLAESVLEDVGQVGDTGVLSAQTAS